MQESWEDVLDVVRGGEECFALSCIRRRGNEADGFLLALHTDGFEFPLQEFQEILVGIHHHVHPSVDGALMIQEQRCEARCDGRGRIVPAPSIAQAERVLHADVADDASRNLLNAQVLHCLCQTLKVLVAECGVETTHHADVAIEHALLDASSAESLRAQFVIFAQEVEGGDGGEELVRRCRNHRFLLIECRKQRVVGEVVNANGGGEIGRLRLLFDGL